MFFFLVECVGFVLCYAVKLPNLSWLMILIHNCTAYYYRSFLEYLQLMDIKWQKLKIKFYMNLKARRDMSKSLTSNIILMSHISVYDRDIILVDLNKGINMSTALFSVKEFSHGKLI